ncbi:hypothetical protein AR276_20375 [Stenotrophomonas maltophilia]|nr:hypothetical protein AR276_20375 [Stenotrophomonas maltophilia]
MRQTWEERSQEQMADLAASRAVSATAAAFPQGSLDSGSEMAMNLAPAEGALLDLARLRPCP